MTRSSTWLSLLVSAALVAGLLAFLVATPDQSTRVQPDELGFSRLGEAQVEAALAHAAAHHRQLHRRAVHEQVAGEVARSWVASLAGTPGVERGVSGTRSGPELAGESIEADARIVDLSRWADDIDPAAWRVVDLSTGAVADADDEWVVDVAIHVRISSASRRLRVIRVPVAVQLGAPLADGRPWRIRDANVDAPRTRLRAYRDPLLAHSGSVDVIAPASDHVLAVALAADASAILDRLRERYADLPGADAVAIWIVQGAATRRTVLGANAPAPDEHHPIAQVADDGDIVVDRSTWLEASDDSRDAAITHALVHVALLGALDDDSFAFEEAIARAEAGPANDEAMQRAADAEVGEVSTLLVAASAASTLDADERLLVHAFGTWLFDERDRASIDRLLASLADGVDADRSIRRALGASPSGVDARVRAWANGKVRPANDDEEDGA